MEHSYFFLFLILFTGGCNIFDSNSDATVVKDLDVVNVDIKSGEEFIYSLGALGDEEQATIKEDSQNASVSELFYDFDATRIVKYRYHSETGFSGKDTVVLEVRRGSDGVSPNTDIYYTVLNFNVKS